MDLARSLYSGAREIKGITPPGKSYKVGMTGPNGMYLSEAHKKSYGGRARSVYNGAKLSYAAVVLEYLLTGRIAALESANDSTIYFEHMRSDGSILYGMYSLNCDAIYATDPGGSSGLCIPFVVCALSAHADKMPETQEIFQEAAQEFNTDGFVSEENLHKFCDAFYYEWKAAYQMSNIRTSNTMNADVVQASIDMDILHKHNAINTAIDMPKFKMVQIDDTASATTVSGISSEGKFANCRDGHYLLNYEWGEEVAGQIPDLSKLDDYVPTDSFFGLVDLIDSELTDVKVRMDAGKTGAEAIGDNYVNVIITGKPGTGKTTLVNALAATFGMPVYLVSPNKHSEEDLFTGMTKAVGGGLKFVETQFLTGFKNGGIILMEEFNQADPAILMGALGQAIEKPFILFEDGYKPVRRHPLCVIVSTMNSGTQGSREPNEAFTSRSPDTIMLDDPTEKDFLAILEKRGYPKDKCKRVYKAYAKIGAFLQQQNARDVAMSITMRHCLAALRRICKMGVPFKQAISDTMIGAIGIKDVELAQDTYKAVIETMVN